MADLEKEKMMRELEVKEIVSKHRSVLQHQTQRKALRNLEEGRGELRQLES